MGPGEGIFHGECRSVDCCDCCDVAMSWGLGFFLLYIVGDIYPPPGGGSWVIGDCN